MLTVTVNDEMWGKVLTLYFQWFIPLLWTKGIKLWKISIQLLFKKGTFF